MALVANAYVRFHAQDTGVMRQIGILDRGINDLQRTFLKFATVTAAVTAFTGMIKQTIDFETALVGVRKTTDATVEQMAKLKQSFKDTAAQTGITKKELASIGQVAGQLGIFTKGGAEGLASFTKTIAKSRIAMKEYAGTSEEAATTTAKLLNILNLEVDQAEDLLSTINQLSNTTAAGSDDIAEFTRRIGGTARTLGASVPSVAALSATLTEVGVNAEMGGTAISQLLIMMQKNLGDFAAVLGKNGAAFKKAFAEDPIVALQLFASELNKFDKASKVNILDNLGINNARMVDTLLKLTGDKGIGSLAATMKTANTAFEEGTSLQREFEIAAEATSTKLAKLWETITNVGESIAVVFLPIIGKAADFMREHIGIVTALAGALASLLGAYLALQATAGILGMFKTLFSVFGLVSGAISGNITMVAGLIKAGGRLAPLLTMINNAAVALSVAFAKGGLAGVMSLLIGLFSQFVLPVAAVVAVVYALVKAYRESAEVQKAVHTITSSLYKIFQALLTILKPLLAILLKIVNFGLKFLVLYVEAAAEAFNQWVEWIKTAVNWLTTLNEKIDKAVLGFLGLKRAAPKDVDTGGWTGSVGHLPRFNEGGGSQDEEEQTFAGGGEDAASKAEEAKKKLKEEEDKLLDLQRDQFNLVKQKLEIERKILLEKKEQGKLTQAEQERLEKIDMFMQNLPEHLFETNDRVAALVEGIDSARQAWEDANKAIDEQAQKVQKLREEIAKIDDEIANIREEFTKEWGAMDDKAVGGNKMTEMAKEAAEQFLKIKEQIAELEKKPERSNEDQEKLLKLRSELAAGELALAKGKNIETQKALELEQQLFQIQAERKGMELEDRAGKRDQAGINARLEQEKQIQAEIDKIRNPQANTFEEAFGFAVQKQEGAQGGTFLDQLKMKFEEEKAERLRQAEERIADEELKKEHLMNELEMERNHLTDLQTARDIAHTKYIEVLNKNQQQVEKLINEHAQRVIAQYAAIEAAAKKAYSAGGISASSGGGGGDDGFASGGFTGGREGQPRGIVHGQEWVAPAWMTKRYGGLFGYLEGMRRGVRGYARGGFVGGQQGNSVTNNNRVEINVPTTVEDPNDLRTVLEEAGFMLTRRLST